MLGSQGFTLTELFELATVGFEAVQQSNAAGGQEEAADVDQKLAVRQQAQGDEDPERTFPERPYGRAGQRPAFGFSRACQN